MKQSYGMVEERFVDYLWQLMEGQVPEILKPLVNNQDGPVIYLKGSTGIQTAVQLNLPPWENMATLGFALFGEFWPHVLPHVDKMIAKRWKARQTTQNAAR